MAAHGIDFLEVWIDNNVAQQRADLTKAEALAKKLVVDAAERGFTIEDLNLDNYSIPKYIVQAMAAPRV